MPNPEVIFVFGSNLLGLHYGGAARVAMERYGAELGVGIGPTGQAYAIPTLGRPDSGPKASLSLSEIGRHVTNFLDYARANPNVVFMTTAIGCGIAGFTKEQIGPLFKGSPENVKLPLMFHDFVFGKNEIVKERVSFDF